MEYAVLALSIVTFLLVIGILVFIIKNNNKKVDNSLNQMELGKIMHQIEALENNIQKDIELAVSKEMIKVMESDTKSQELNNEKLERFQKNIVESLNARFEFINNQINEKMAEINKKVEEKMKAGFESTTETMTQVRERLKVIDEAQKNIESLSKDVVSLRNIMEGNQTRGQYGEYQLSMVLHNVFGDTVGCYQEQYTIKRSKDGDDVRADAVVFMPEPNKMICIDSKFPFQDYERLFDAENEEERETYKKEFARAVKQHITVIKDKYIIDGKTAPEALMFIPNDGVFAFIHHELQDVVEYAREKKVILTSPSTLPAILVTINMVRIEAERAKNVKEISRQLAILGKQFELFAKEWDTLSRQLETATRSREKLDSRVNRITSKFDAIASNSDVGQIEEEVKTEE
ncbi:MAG: DNA recombination protein RmuC [Bacilli bacterium]|nr:DNA recombination protein RmuC [Bacilli bacterium]